MKQEVQVRGCRMNEADSHKMVEIDLKIRTDIKIMPHICIAACNRLFPGPRLGLHGFLPIQLAPKVACRDTVSGQVH